MRVSSEHIHNQISTPTTTTPKAAWKLGDPSSFQDLFSSGVAADSSTPPAATSSSTAIAATPVAVLQEMLAPPTFEQGATVAGPDGTASGLNPMEMASQDTADQLAAKLGGTVTSETFGGGFSTSASIRDISFSGTNVRINAGIAASLFAMYGDAQGSQAWQTINNDLGRDPSATGPVS